MTKKNCCTFSDSIITFDTCFQAALTHNNIHTNFSSSLGAIEKKRIQRSLNSDNSIPMYPGDQLHYEFSGYISFNNAAQK